MNSIQLIIQFLMNELTLIHYFDPIYLIQFIQKEFISIYF